MNFTRNFMNKKDKFLRFPVLTTALRILARVPNASSTCEISFSSINLFKNCNFSTMKSDGLSALAMLNIFLIFTKLQKMCYVCLQHYAHRD